VSGIAALTRHPFMRFALIGAGGYLVDTLVLALDTRVLDPFSGRVLSIFVAMTFTWLGNRILTFPQHAARGSLSAIAHEWLRFTGANIVGAVINYTIYALLLSFAGGPFADKFVAQACGVGAGLLFNFTLSKTLVFRSGL
jgi:putative flippase GtrA